MSCSISTFSISGLLIIAFRCTTTQVDAIENNTTTSTHGFDGPRYRINALLGWPLLLTCNSSSVGTNPRWLWIQDEPLKRQLWLRNNETSFYEFSGLQLFIPTVRQKYEHKSSYLCMEQHTMTGVAYYINLPKSGWLFPAWILQIIIIGSVFGLSVCILVKRK
uniref:Ig-like domain-containing protein n=1 Tax=Romanomermis culicivorax TaxID=13658 RepID=A0A915KAQ9_ROMCU